MEEISEHSDEIIELTQIVQDDQDGSEKKDASIDTARQLSDEKGYKDPNSTPSESSKEIPVELIESAIEKWLEKKFQAKIEPMMQQVVERVLEREIRRIGKEVEEKIDKIQMVSSKTAKRP